MNDKLQVIIVDHVQLSDEKFRNSVIESWWENNENLIPLEWIQNRKKEIKDDKRKEKNQPKQKEKYKIGKNKPYGYDTAPEIIYIETVEPSFNNRRFESMRGKRENQKLQTKMAGKKIACRKPVRWKPESKDNGTRIVSVKTKKRKQKKNQFEG